MPLFIALAVMALLSIGTALLQKRGRQSNVPDATAAYEAMPALLTPAERSFFGVLKKALANDYQIFVKVRLADIVRPASNPSRSGWQAAFNRIAGKHVDFVLCEPTRLGVVGVIELDDKSHENLDRGIRDSLVDSALAGAKVPILRISARRDYAPTEIRQQVETLCRSTNLAQKTSI